MSFAKSYYFSLQVHLLFSALCSQIFSVCIIITYKGKIFLCTPLVIKKNIGIVLVLILSVRGVLVRKFMLAAYSLGMTRGDWTFLDVEIFQV
jgi:hypothetical protein